jgi:hypothetical protein
VKSCSRCSTEKPLTEFRLNARYAGGHVTWCRACESAYRSEHHARNAEKDNARNREWYAANKAGHNKASRENYRANPAAHGERVRRAKLARPDHYREGARERARRQRELRPDVRLRSRISAQLRAVVTTGKGGKKASELLGYSMEELRLHLERQFLPGMGWHNAREWHIDHIVPLSSFTITGTDDPELRRAWALANLRPLWAKDNIAKGAQRVSLL